MVSYLLLVFSAVLLAVNFSLTKVYEQKCGTAFKTGLIFNILSGFSTAIIFFVVNGFKIELTMFSIVLAILQVSANVSYTLVGFKIMEMANVADYTFYLMTGGMTVPYVFGILFLNESVKPVHLLGLLLIIISLLIMNGKGKQNGKILIFNIAVFLLNGIVSVTSKVHQIGKNAVPTTDFIVLKGFITGVVCLTVYLIINKKFEFGGFNKNGIWLGIIIAAIGGVSYYFQLKGAIILPATVCYPIITGGTIIFTAIAGALCFKEKIKPKSALGMGLCLIGTCLFL